VLRCSREPVEDAIQFVLGKVIERNSMASAIFEGLNASERLGTPSVIGTHMALPGTIEKPEMLQAGYPRLRARRHS
jgi:hypothetical protein